MLNRSDAKQNAGVTGYSPAAKSVFLRSVEAAAAAPRPPQPRRSRISRGQAMVEFALISTLAIIVMVVGVQYALIGQAALAVSQGASVLARYAAVNPGALGDSTGNGAATLNTAAQQLLSSSICPDSTCSKLTVTIASYQGNSTTSTTAKPALGDRLVINLSYNATSKIALPLSKSGTFLGISFPTTLAASDSQMYE